VRRCGWVRACVFGGKCVRVCLGAIVCLSGEGCVQRAERGRESVRECVCVCGRECVFLTEGGERGGETRYHMHGSTPHVRADGERRRLPEQGEHC